MWTAATLDITVYWIAASRGTDVVYEMLGEEYAGIVVRDGWAPYRQLMKAEHHTCLAHLMRRCDEILEPAHGWAREIPRAVKAIRPAVVNRKVWGGNRTPRGARTQEVLTSLMQTCRQRGVNVLDYLADIQRRPPGAAPILVPIRAGRVQVSLIPCRPLCVSPIIVPWPRPDEPTCSPRTASRRLTTRVRTDQGWATSAPRWSSPCAVNASHWRGCAVEFWK